MEDPNLIAWLYPYDRSPHAINAITDPDNSSLHFPPMLQKDAAPSLQSRESTPEREDNNEEHLNYLYDEGLQLTFSNRPKGDKGFCLGRDKEKCDIFLPDKQRRDGISACHCYFTFDNQNRLILRDESSNGTIVAYDKKGAERRRNFTWILGGHSVPDEIKEITIQFHRSLQFQIVVPKAWKDPDQYSANIKQFRQQMNASDDLYLGKLGIRSGHTTAPLSQVQTPTPDPILLEQKVLGSGSFGVVTHHWDVSTGVEYACKKPLGTLNKKMQQSWEKEVRIMGRITHENIVKFYPAIESLVPCLYLEYLPCGSLEKQHRQNPISYRETFTILRQCLSALKYLHEQNPPIAHRDLKPANILVRERDPLHVQLADFGLAKEGTSLRSHVGTKPYLPPEFATAVKPREKYTVKVDIWSLGVVALRFTHNLPSSDCDGISWCNRIIDRANTYNNEDLMNFLMTHMLVLKPEARSSAKACLKAVEDLPVRFRDGSRTPTQASSAEGVLPTGQSISPDNEIPGFSSSRINAYINTNACLPESRKRLAQSQSSSDTIRASKRLAQKAGHNNNHQQREQKDSEFNPFHPNWLQDPNCVGSVVAEMGREDPSGWNSGSNANSTTTNASGEDHAPRRTWPNVSEQHNDSVRASRRLCTNSEEELGLLLQNNDRG
ncbi:hypothetical protein EMCG_09486 [[Emmonsia] crescens]|uniref:non-specific serine/threonine protein kinase n=1 Tax=[Emmonsia] crescens TaxID=73230 RepID=A0A0G2I326_9EURO|nr:hypothetical protein EMCG_09486 [Emmonsia crescens UAMH 3008]